ncbi:MAG: M23 family metallopeptidase [Candidatus Saccharimonadales bacterium]
MKSVKFSLPFNGSWLTFWGGDTAEQNHHHSVASQKFAFDFIQTDKDNKFFRTNGKTNNDYFSFGADILAPADGVVIETVNGLRDNKPSELNSFNYIGNYIMIKHEGKLFSVLGHLKQNSIVVSVGDTVKRGQKIAKCGNSGYTTDPHLHFHIQNSDVFAKVNKDYKRIDIAKGQKVFFDKIIVLKDDKKKTKNDYSPVKGDIIANI